MRVVSLLLALLPLSLVWAQQEKKDNLSQELARMQAALAESEAVLQGWEANAPSTLTEAHAALERMLAPETLAKIDAMASEDDMIKYHFSLGLNIRNGWGLWGDSPLAKHMRELGFTHPDDMSGVILDTFWCKRHGQDFRLEERAAKYKQYWDGVQKAKEEEQKRVEKVKEAISKMMMRLRFEKRDVPVVQTTIKNGLNVRFVCPFRGGVFLTFYCQGRISSDQYTPMAGRYFDADGTAHTDPQYDDSVARGFYVDRADGEVHKLNPGDDFFIQGCYLDPADQKTHIIRVPEVNEVYAAVVVGNRAWFAGMTNGKAVLVGIGERDHITVPLPQEDEIPDLGMDGQSLLAVYPRKILRLTNREWTVVHSGDILLPRSGFPPQLHGNMVFFRDEGRNEDQKRLWWLTMGERPHLSVLDRNVGLVGPDGPYWYELSSYCVTSNGDLWACIGERSWASLLRRSKDGSYSIAIMNCSVGFTGDLGGRDSAYKDMSISAVTALSDDTLLLAGHTGLYRLKGNELVQEVAFSPQETKDGSGRVVGDGEWNPSNVLMLNDQSYVIGTAMWDGVYLLRRGGDGQWTFMPVDRSDDAVVW